jgi:hypothetical protein
MMFTKLSGSLTKTDASRVTAPAKISGMSVGRTSPKLHRMIHRRTPSKRESHRPASTKARTIVSPAWRIEIGPLAVYLATDPLRYVTGVAFVIDRGFSLCRPMLSRPSFFADAQAPL